MGLESYLKKGVIEAGCDEAGRGCLAGPVVAAAVIFPEGYQNDLLDDSKKLSFKAREELKKIVEQDAISYAVGVVTHQEIDKINILNGSFLAMHRALDQLTIAPEHILVDGNRFNSYNDVEHTTVVKGDGKYLSIAAASILAKTYRDDLMVEYSKSYPQYGWDRNMGYPTKQHRLAIEQFGITSLHRKSFKCKETQLKLEF